MTDEKCPKCHDWGYVVVANAHAPAQRMPCECGQPMRDRGYLVSPFATRGKR